jgi:hypothetical protein
MNMMNVLVLVSEYRQNEMNVLVLASKYKQNAMNTMNVLVLASN